MRYSNPVTRQHRMEARDKRAFSEAARAANMDLTQWINQTCRAALERGDRRNPSNRERRSASMEE